MKTRLTTALAAVLATVLLGSLSACTGGTDADTTGTGSATSPTETPAAEPDEAETPDPAPDPLIPFGDDQSRGTLKFVPADPSFALLGDTTVDEAKALVTRSDTFMREVYARPDRFAKDATHYLSSEDIEAIEALGTAPFVRRIMKDIRVVDRVARAGVERDKNGDPEVEPTKKEKDAIADALVMFSSSSDKRHVTYKTEMVKAYTNEAKGWRDLLTVYYKLSTSRSVGAGANSFDYYLGWKKLADGQWRVETAYYKAHA